ncbi:MAG: hypothetical protein ACI4WS_06630, partial [Oscillospiraceae bacterium]
IDKTSCCNRTTIIMRCCLIFDSDVSKEYLRLYEAGCLTAEELDSIRLSGGCARSDSRLL